MAAAHDEDTSVTAHECRAPTATGGRCGQRVGVGQGRCRAGHPVHPATRPAATSGLQKSAAAAAITEAMSGPPADPDLLAEFPEFTAAMLPDDTPVRSVDPATVEFVQRHVTVRLTAVRLIAKAHHERPDGTRCTGAISALVVDRTHRGSERTRFGSRTVWRHINRTYGNLEDEGWDPGQGSWSGDCPGCGKSVRMRFKPVRGTHTPDKGCSPRCEAATGPNCECSCAGTRHGASWS